MPSEPTEAQLAWATEQFRKALADMVSVATEHMADCPQPELDCPGGYVQATLKRMTHRELMTMCEVAVVAIVREKVANANLISNAETLAEEGLLANALPAHWCKECRVRHA